MPLSVDGPARRPGASHRPGARPPRPRAGTAAAARCSRRLRRLSRWRLTWRPSSSATRLTEWLRSREASLARSVTPLRCRVASATWFSGLAGLRSLADLDLEHRQLAHLLGDLLEAARDVLAQLVGDRKVAPLDLDLHGTPLMRRMPVSLGCYRPFLQRSRIGDGGHGLGAAAPSAPARRRRASRRWCGRRRRAARRAAARRRAPPRSGPRCAAAPGRPRPDGGRGRRAAGTARAAARCARRAPRRAAPPGRTRAAAGGRGAPGPGTTAPERRRPRRSGGRLAAMCAAISPATGSAARNFSAATRSRAAPS